MESTNYGKTLPDSLVQSLSTKLGKIIGQWKDFDYALPKDDLIYLFEDLSGSINDQKFSENLVKFVYENETNPNSLNNQIEYLFPKQIELYLDVIPTFSRSIFDAMYHYQGKEQTNNLPLNEEVDRKTPCDRFSDNLNMAFKLRDELKEGGCEF